MNGPILRPGRNCWRLARADRVTFLIDGAAYFAAFRATAARARHSLWLIGWDFDSRTELVRGEPPGDSLPVRLGPFLDTLARRRPELHVYILEWDFAMLYAIEREILPIYKLGWRTHRRVRFHLDDAHPIGASHHQKIVVADDAVAFVGGLDLTKRRWDTPAHEPGNPHRVGPDGEPYGPFHDVQLAVEGEAAAALGELARERWRRATRRAAPPPAPGRAPGEVWPEGLEADLSGVEVAIARTEPNFRGHPEVQEVKQLYLDAIAAAERCIYIENQYFTAGAIGDALAERLRADSGPEVLVVSRLQWGGWLEETTMQVLRARFIRRLREADRHGRLRVLYPYREGLETPGIDLHSKLMVVDERLVRVGSANLASRSMGLDTECDLAIEANDRRAGEAIARLRDRLLAEHLGVEPAQVARAFAQSGSLIAVVERFAGGTRTLKALEPEIASELEALVPDGELIDPERPVDPEELVERLLPEEEQAPVGRRLAVVATVIVGLAALAAAWRWTPLGDWVDMATLERAVAALGDSPATPLWVLGIYLVGSLVALPITLLVFATAALFGPLEGFLYALGGAMLGAVVTFGLGHLLGRETIRRLAGSRLNTLSRHLGSRGLLAVITVRMLPVAPFTVVNLVAGASHIRFRDFALGTLAGMAPGIAAITVFSDRLLAALRNPSPMSFVALALVIAVIVAGAELLRRWLRRRSARRARAAEGG